MRIRHPCWYSSRLASENYVWNPPAAESPPVQFSFPSRVQISVGTLKLGWLLVHKPATWPQWEALQRWRKERQRNVGVKTTCLVSETNLSGVGNETNLSGVGNETNLSGVGNKLVSCWKQTCQVTDTSFFGVGNKLASCRKQTCLVAETNLSDVGDKLVRWRKQAFLVSVINLSGAGN